MRTTKVSFLLGIATASLFLAMWLRRDSVAGPSTSPPQTAAPTVGVCNKNELVGARDPKADQEDCGLCGKPPSNDVTTPQDPEPPPPPPSDPGNPAPPTTTPSDKIGTIGGTGLGGDGSGGSPGGGGTLEPHSGAIVCEVSVPMGGRGATTCGGYCLPSSRELAKYLGGSPAQEPEDPPPG